MEGDGLEFGEDLSDASGVVEPGSVALDLLGTEIARDGPSVGAPAGLLQVGAVQLGGVGTAPAAGFAAAHAALDHAAWQDVADCRQFSPQAANRPLVSGVG